MSQFRLSMLGYQLQKVDLKWKSNNQALNLFVKYEMFILLAVQPAVESTMILGGIIIS